jgi:MFS transporter, PPP family, 3-phenylpropionic acid transporter
MLDTASGVTTEAAKRGFAVRMSAFYGAMFLVLGTSMAYLPSWLASKGFTASEIGWFAAAPLLLRLIVTPAIAFVADRAKAHERAIVLLAALAGMALLLVAGRADFWPILLLVTLFQLSMQATMPLAETIAMRGVNGGLDYGRMRLWGSLSFVAGTYLCGQLVDWRGMSAVIWFLFASAVLTFIAAVLLPPQQVMGPVVLRSVAGLASPAAPAKSEPRGIAGFVASLRLIGTPGIIWFLLASGAVQAAHALFYTFGVLHWRGVGLTPGWIGSLWAISIAVEVALFSWSGAVVSRVGAWNLVAIGAAASVIRWTAMAFDPALPWLILLQVMHALTYAGTHLGAMHFIRTQVPEHQAGMVQALNVTVSSGVLMGLAQVLSGQTYGVFGAASYLGMAALALAALAVCVMRRVAQPRAGAGSSTRPS